MSVRALAMNSALAGLNTSPPWAAFEGNEADGVNCADDEQLTWDDHGGEVFKPADAEFIAHARTDVPKLIAALEAVEAVIAEHESRAVWPDADKVDKAYSLGKRHAYDRVRHEITEALK